MEYIIAHDFGTSSAKASLFQTDGTLVKSSTLGYSTAHADAACAEQDAGDWWKVFCANNHCLLDGLADKTVLCVSFSGTYPNCLLVDQNAKPLHRALIWQDTRATEEAKEISGKLPAAFTARAPGGVVSPNWGLPKLLWVKKHCPDVFERADKMLPCASNYIILKLTGKAVCDYSVAYGTSMIQRGTKNWSDEVLAIAGIPASLMPELHDRTDVIGSVSAGMAEECGLPAGTKIICGTVDSDCTAIGGGLLKPGDAFLLSGTSAEINAIDPSGRKIGRPTNSSGASLDWLRDTIAFYEMTYATKNQVDVFDLINRKVKEAEVGCGGVIFLPYLAGERGVWYDPMARGSFTGISLSTTREDLMRAVVEGIGFNLNLLLQDILAAGIEVKELPVVGGLGKGEAVRQIFADIFGIPLVTFEHMDQAAVAGAAVLGGMGLGIYPDLSAVSRFMRRSGVTLPNEENHKKYQEIMPKFKAVYLALKPFYNA